MKRGTRKPEADAGSRQPGARPSGRLVSIVIPTRNSAATLGACLESIRGQTYRSHEVIIVDASSSDATQRIAEAADARLIRKDGPPPVARNAGFAVARGEIFVSIDSDMVLEPTVLEDIVRGMGGAPVLIIPETGYGSDFVSRCRDLEKRCYLGDESVEAARAFSRHAFLSVGGYLEALHFGEDWDLHDRLKKQFLVGRIRSRVMHDRRALSLFGALGKSYRYGRTLGSYLRQNPDGGRSHMGHGRLLLLRYRRKLMREPALAFGLIAMKCAEYFAAGTGMVAARLGL